MNKTYKQLEIKPDKKRVRLDIDSSVLRLAKSKAASQEISLSWAVEELLRQWLSESHRKKNGGDRE